MKTSLVLAFVTLALGAAPAFAGTLHVPGDAPTIQGAIVLANSGDTILVAPGTYVETIDLLGKQLVIEGTGGAAATTIDGNGGGSTVSVHTHEPAGTAIRGFTITGGTGQDVIIDPGFMGQPETVHGGGGVHVGGSAHLELADCVVANNSALIPAPVPQSFGGGVYLSGGTLTMSGCTLSGNSAKLGAGLSLAGNAHTLTASHCTLTGNTVGSALYSYYGHGTVSDSEVADNAGHGVSLFGYSLKFSRCSVRGNAGWGVTCYGDVGADIIGFSLLGNGLGGAACAEGKIFGSEDIVVSCIFANGDTLDVSQNLFAHIDRCSFADAPIDAGGSILDIRNSIGRGTTTINGVNGADVTYSDFVGLGTGTGNIDADPLWVDAANDDYHLLPSSPCIDAGNPGSPLDPDGTRADMGAVPFDNAFDDLGGGVAGSAGAVHLAAHSTMEGGEGVVFALSGTPPFKPTLLLLGISQLGAPFKGGTLWPTPNAVISGLVTNASGQLTLSSTWPPAIPSGFKLWAQFWHGDVGAAYGFAGSNGVRGTVP